MSRRVLLILLASSLLATAAVLLRPSPRGARITSANYQRIQDGMTEAEVNGILGGPPGEYRAEPGFVLVGPGHIPRSEGTRGGKLEVWYCEGFHVEVLYDGRGRVAGKYWHDTEASR